MKLKTIPCRNRGRSSTARIRIELGRYSSLHQVFLLRFTFPISKSDLLVSISLLLVRKSDFLVSISLLLVSKSDFLVADELASFSDDLSTERAHWLHPFNLTCSWSRVRFVPSRNGTGEFARALEVNRPQERSFPMPNSARSILILGMLVFSPWVLAQGDLGSISGMVSNTDHAIVASAPIQVKSLETGATYK